MARVVVDVGLAHLDRPFDYRVPAHLDADAVPGVRVRVRFAGRLVDGFLLDRAEESAHTGRLAWVDKVVSPEPVLTPEVERLCRSVADRQAGMLTDVLRLAVPPRHARVEKETPRSRTETPPLPDPDPDGWTSYPRGSALLDALSGGRVAHAVWQALPGETWAVRLAEAAVATLSAGRSALLVVPDQRDVDVLEAACAARVGADGVVALSADLGPAERYRRWLAVRRGAVRVVVGTRSAAFAPLSGLGLLAIWDDGDDSHTEPRAPYPHVRDVLVLRAHQAGAALLVGGFARTAEAQVLVATGWASEVMADRATVRARSPRVTAIGETDTQLARDPTARAARVPAVAFEAARAALGSERPVLVQVPRSGYLPWLACATCRETARCRHCAGPLGLPQPSSANGSGPDRPSFSGRGARSTSAVEDRAGGRGAAPDTVAGGARPGRAEAADAARPGGRVPDGAGPVGAGSGRGAPADAAAAGLPHCRWCGRAEPAFRCAGCGSRRLRAGVVGAGRTADELGRAFPGVTIRTSGGGAPVLDAVPAGPSLVVATPGAEPAVDGGYGAALLLDGWAMLSRPDLAVAEETLRRWMGAAAAVVPHADGGRVVVVADSSLPTVQALVRWDPAGHAVDELAARAEVGFPPAVRMAAVEGAADAVAETVDAVTASADAPESLELLGPVEIDPPDRPGERPPGSDDQLRERMLLRVPRADGRRLAAALAAAQAGRSARKATDTVRVRMDPTGIG
ncbi:primosomal protein N' (replication factor Y) [Pseudonocardia endophytica]|uniref:Probable replication restart protein PriA n=1 Tax=Pseudonocardia endophytica TaxID=401976 RepID=A0A4R1HQK0_PSEEN|nr:primosomal protein N' (replication factor Y) [Pseudonocardia endophytica]